MIRNTIIAFFVLLIGLSAWLIRQDHVTEPVKPNPETGYTHLTNTPILEAVKGRTITGYYIEKQGVIQLKLDNGKTLRFKAGKYVEKLELQ